VALCHQIKTIDYAAHGVRYVEKAPASIVQNALARVRTIVA